LDVKKKKKKKKKRKKKGFQKKRGKIKPISEKSGTEAYKYNNAKKSEREV
jgi:hypothetical protein